MEKTLDLKPLDLSGSQKLRFVIVCNLCGTRIYHSQDLLFFQGMSARTLANYSRHKCPYCSQSSGNYQVFAENR